MAYDVNNILIANLSQLTVDGTDVGGTASPLVFTVTSEREEFFIEQSAFPVKRQLVQRTARTEVTLAEATLANLAIAFGLPAANLVSDVLTIDNADRGTFTFTAVGVAGSAPNNKTRTIDMPQTVVEGDASINMARREMSQMALTFAHLANSSGVIGTITDA